MKLRAGYSSASLSDSTRVRLPVRVASWLLVRPLLGQTQSAKRVAGHLLKQPARQGVVLAQSRLGQLLCRDCGNSRDRRIGLDLLRQAARAGDPLAQLEFGRPCGGAGRGGEERARGGRGQPAARGARGAPRLLGRLSTRS